MSRSFETIVEELRRSVEGRGPGPVLTRAELASWTKRLAHVPKERWLETLVELTVLLRRSSEDAKSQELTFQLEALRMSVLRRSRQAIALAHAERAAKRARVFLGTSSRTARRSPGDPTKSVLALRASQIRPREDPSPGSKAKGVPHPLQRHR